MRTLCLTSHPTTCTKRIHNLIYYLYMNSTKQRLEHPTVTKMASITIIAVILLALRLAPPSAADVNNVLLTGDVLSTDDQLSYGDAVFVIQNDCNLVLYNDGPGFSSKTNYYGSGCILSLNDVGQLVINGSDSQVWTSSAPSKKGNYAAVLRPDQSVVVYGPSVWSIPASGTAAAGDTGAELAEIPKVVNLLFSDQTLYNNSKLATRDYTLTMQSDCDLTLFKGTTEVWDSKTKGKGTNCFARLDHRGKLSVVNDKYKALFSSNGGSKEGDYVLILQIDGKAVIYGPAIWSTSSG